MDLDLDGVEEEDEEEEVGSEEEEEDEWNGLGDSGTDAPISGPSGGGGKPKKPPTGEEVRAIKEATDLYKSNTFKLRVRSISDFSIDIVVCASSHGLGECIGFYSKTEYGMANHLLEWTLWPLRDAKYPLNPLAYYMFVVAHRVKRAYFRL